MIGRMLEEELGPGARVFVMCVKVCMSVQAHMPATGWPWVSFLRC